MIEVVFRVREVWIHLTEKNEKQDDYVIDKAVDKKYSLPSKMEYNNSWIFSFVCGVCNETISINGITKSFDNKFEVLFEPHISQEKLKEIATLFKDMKTFSTLEEPEKLYLTSKNYNDKNKSSLFIPKVRIYHNSCPSCGSHILYWLNDESPRPPSREYHSGGPGLLKLNEIIGVSIDDDLKIKDYIS